jgi:hypothetical protein
MPGGEGAFLIRAEEFARLTQYFTSKAYSVVENGASDGPSRGNLALLCSPPTRAANASA